MRRKRRGVEERPRRGGGREEVILDIKPGELGGEIWEGNIMGRRGGAEKKKRGMPARLYQERGRRRRTSRRREKHSTRRDKTEKCAGVWGEKEVRRTDSLNSVTLLRRLELSGGKMGTSAPREEEPHSRRSEGGDSGGEAA